MGTLTNLVRSQEGTTAASSVSSGATVSEEITARHHTALRDAIIQIQAALGRAPFGIPLRPNNLGWVNIVDRGAVADNVTDNSAVINQAITDMNNAGGGIVYVPAAPPTPFLYSQIVMRSGVWLMGQGYGSLLQSTVHNPNSASIVTASINEKNFMITGLRLEGNRAAQGTKTTVTSASSGAALPVTTLNVASTTNFAATGTCYVTVEGVPQAIAYTGLGGATTITGCSGGTGTLQTGMSVQTAQPTDCIGINQVGISSSGSADGNIIADLWINGWTGNGIATYGSCTGWYFTRNHLFFCNGDGIHFGDNGGTGPGPTDHHLTDTDMVQAGEHCVNDYGQNHYTGCKVGQGAFGVSGNYGCGFKFNEGLANLTACEAQLCGLHGFMFDGVIYSSVAYNHHNGRGLAVDNCYGSAFYFNGCSNNTIEGWASKGGGAGATFSSIVQFAGSCSNNDVEVHYDPTILSAGSSPLVGSQTGGRIILQGYGGQLETGLNFNLRSDATSAMVIPSGDYGCLERISLSSTGSLEISSNASVTIYSGVS